MHGDEGRAEDQQQDSDLDDAGRVPGRPEDPRGVSESGAQQVKTRRSLRTERAWPHGHQGPEGPLIENRMDRPRPRSSDCYLVARTSPRGSSPQVAAILSLSFSISLSFSFTRFVRFDSLGNFFS